MRRQRSTSPRTKPSRVVEVELNPNLRVNSVRDAAGKPMSYRSGRQLQPETARLSPDTVPAGGKVTLQFDYGGPLSSRIDDPTAKCAAREHRQGRRIFAAPGALVPAHGFPLEPVYGSLPDRSARNDDRRGHRRVLRPSGFGHAQINPGAGPGTGKLSARQLRYRHGTRLRLLRWRTSAYCTRSAWKSRRRPGTFVHVAAATKPGARGRHEFFGLHAAGGGQTPRRVMRTPWRTFSISTTESLARCRNPR